MRHEPRAILLRLAPPLAAAVALLAPSPALAGPSPDAKPGSGPAPDPYPAATAKAPARVVTPVREASAPPAAVVVSPPVSSTHVVTTPARTVKRHPAPAKPKRPAVRRSAPVVDVEPLRVDIAAGLGSIGRAERDIAAPAIALLIAALAAATGSVLVLSTRDLA